MAIAKIIVDVPLMQTDQPYSYKIPEEFVDMLEAGMRVHVPFGKANRLIQGIVLGVEQESEMADEDLKEIAEVLDFSPVLTEEQLWLAEELRKSVFSYKISILKAMLPGFLNSSYDKILYPLEGLSQEEKERLFGSQESLAFSSLDLKKQAEMMRLTRKGLLKLEYQAIDQKKVKTQSWIQVNLDKLEQLEISNRAKKKLELRDYLLAHPESTPLAALLEHYSREQVNFFVEQGALTILQKEVQRSATYFEGIESNQALELNPEQKQAYEAVVDAIGKQHPPFLLQGITGSGKTEVYLQIIKGALDMGKTAIVLVPEISLTPQMTERFIARFGDKVAILHSGLSNGEKYDEWRKVERGDAQVVVGARSAVFAPLKNLGVIIIDEEHEASYKQDSKGVYQHLRLTQRANPLASIPEVQLIDFRDYIGQNETSNYTPPLIKAIQDRLDKKEQVVLMLNRRGYSSFVMCRECGTVDTCPNCDISLTLHMDTKTMNCHYCGFSKEIPHVCSNCQSRSIRYYGTGTQKAYDELTELFPEARILRMDVDTTRKKGSHQALLDQFGKGEADILLGTQMIAKGLDFPNVTLVGVLNADTALNLPDFRSSERTFQLLTQVAGRAGRAEKAGQVLIQSYNPQHYAIRFAKDQDYEGFYAYEMGTRRQLGYPPYYFTIGITLSHKKEEEVLRRAYQVMEILRSGLSDASVILGPTPKPIARTHNLYHYQILIKYRLEDELASTLNQVLALTQERENSELRLSIDHEPQQFL